MRRRRTPARRERKKERKEGVSQDIHTNARRGRQVNSCACWLLLTSLVTSQVKVSLRVAPNRSSGVSTCEIFLNLATISTSGFDLAVGDRYIPSSAVKYSVISRNLSSVRSCLGGEMSGAMQYSTPSCFTFELPGGLWLKVVARRHRIGAHARQHKRRR